jgi:hypothetical protein
MPLVSVTAELSPELQERVAEVLGRLGTGESEGVIQTRKEGMPLAPRPPAATRRSQGRGTG